MKKLLYLITVALLLVALTGCAGSVSGNELFVDLSVCAGADDSIKITWSDSDTLNRDLYMYSIYLSDSADGTFEKKTTPYASVGSATLSGSFDGVEFGGTYYVKLEALDVSYDTLDVEDPFSDVFEVTVRAADIFPVIWSGYSSTTYNSDDSVNKDRVFISWSIEADPTYSDIDDLEIYRKTGDGDYSFLYSPLNSADEHYDDTVVDGTTYTYKVRVTYKDTYTDATEAYYESNEKTVTYSTQELTTVTLDEPTLNSITVDTSDSSYACTIGYDYEKNNSSGDVGAYMRFVDADGASTVLTYSDSLGISNVEEIDVLNTYLDAGTYTLYTKIFVEFGSVIEYSDYCYKTNIVIE